MEIIKDNLPLVLGYVVLVYGIAIVALVDVLRQSRYKLGNKIFWSIIVVIFHIFGPLMYFVFGKEEKS